MQKTDHVAISAIATPEVPSSPLFSQALKIGGVMLLSGIVGVDKQSGKAADTIEAQTEQAIRNCEAILKAGGASLSHVVRVLVLLKDPTDFAGMNSAYAKYFVDRPPARAVARLGVDVGNLLVSLVMTAIVSDEINEPLLASLSA